MAFKQPSVTMATGGWIDGQAFEILLPNNAHTYTLKKDEHNSMVFLCLFPEWGWGLSWANMGVPFQRRTERTRTPAPSWTSPSQVQHWAHTWRDVLGDVCCSHVQLVMAAEARTEENSRRWAERIKRMHLQKRSGGEKKKAFIRVHPRLKDTVLFLSTPKAEVEMSHSQCSCCSCNQSCALTLEK